MAVRLQSAAVMIMAALERTSILVVEDDSSSRDALLTLLSAQGFGVRAARDGQEALDLLQSGLRPGLVILDLSLPKVSGAELLKYTHQDLELRSIPVIVVTAAPPPRADLLADLIFTKPVDVARLLDAVKRLVREPTAI
jgi:CheY-like chemotaxis protein